MPKEPESPTFRQISELMNDVYMPKSIYGLAKKLGVEYKTLYRMFQRQSMRSQTLDKILQVFNLKIVPRDQLPTLSQSFHELAQNRKTQKEV